MTDAALWRLTLEIVVLAIVVGGGGYFWTRHLARKFDRDYGNRQTPGK